VRDELARLLASPVFAHAERLSEFLRFVVEGSLGGQGGQLKETTIGVEVYGRDPGYEPRVEPIVRTEARRLRAKLDEYYQTLGQDDPVTIRLPKGAYVAHFEIRPVPCPVPAPVPVAVAPPQVRVGLRRWAIGCLGVCVLLGLYISLRPGTVPPLPVVRPLTSYPGYEFQPALSPDGKQFAFVYDGESNNFDIYVKLLDAGTALRLTTNPALDLHPTWSPDGRYLAFLRVSPAKQEIFVVPAMGGAERKIAEITSAAAAWQEEGSAMHNTGPAWSPDGGYLAVGDRPDIEGPDAVYLYSVDTGKRRKLTAPDSESIGDSMPVFSPDGRQIAFVRTASQRGIMDIFVIPLSGSGEKRLTWDRKTISGLTWSTGRRLLFSSNRSGGTMIWSIPAKGGTPEPLTIAGRSVRDVTASPDGSRVLYTDRVQNSNIWRVDLTAGQAAAPQQILASTGRNDSLQYSPDGRRIVFGSDRSGSYDLWTANADGSNLLQITNFGGLPVGTPRWSPDGRQIVFDAVKDGRSVIYRIDSNGGQPQLFLEDPGDAMMPTWARDGQAIYFVSRREGNARSIWKKLVRGGAPVEIAHGTVGDAIESPDGRFIYYSDGEDGIWQASSDGKDAHRIPELSEVHDRRYCAVTRTGIYFLRNSKPPCKIQFYDFATGRIASVATMAKRPALGTPSLSVSPDDHWLLYAQVDTIGSDIMMLTGLR
jgi:Tol biopolymer transport system component